MISSTGYLNHLGQWEGYPYAVSAEGLDAAYPVSLFLNFLGHVYLSDFTAKLATHVSPQYANNSQVMYGAYSPLSAIGDSQTYFSLLCPMSSPCYQPPASSTGYSSPGTGISQFDPMHQYYFPDEVHYSPTPGFYQPFGSFNGSKNSFC